MTYGHFDSVTVSLLETVLHPTKILFFVPPIRYVSVVSCNRRVDIYASATESQLIGRLFPGETGFFQLPYPTQNLYLKWGAITGDELGEDIPALDLWASWEPITRLVTHAEPLRLGDRPTLTFSHANPAANAGATITLGNPGADTFHYITQIDIGRVGVATLAGAGQLTITTTNLGGLEFETGDAILIGERKQDVLVDFGGHPLRSTAAATASTVVLPAPGAGVRWSASIYSFTAQ